MVSKLDELMALADDYMLNKPAARASLQSALKAVVEEAEEAKQRSDAIEAWAQRGNLLFDGGGAGAMFALGKWWGERPWRNP